MNAYGLTGNIGCGKSTVASLLAQYPTVRIFDCDRIAKEVVASEELRAPLTRILGEKAFTPSGPNWSFIRDTIFTQRRIKLAVEAKVHVRVWCEVERRVAETADDALCIVESALIFESGSAGIFRGVIVATCEEGVQFERLIAKRGMSPEAIRERLRHQLRVRDKVQQATYVIDTTCTMEVLEERVRMLHEKLTSDKGGWR